MAKLKPRKKLGFRPAPVKRVNQLYMALAVTLGVLLLFLTTWAIYETTKTLNQAFRVQGGPPGGALFFQIQAAESIKRLSLVPGEETPLPTPSPSQATSSPTVSPPVR